MSEPRPMRDELVRADCPLMYRPATLPAMGRPRTAKPVRLFAGLLSGDADLLRRTRQVLARRYGPIDLESEVWPFTDTDYYREAMGASLLRQFVSFERLIRPDDLAEIKLTTNRLEDELAEERLAFGIARPVNIDPGYIDLAKVVLATTKDRAHRIYVGSGICAEVTLYRENEAWQASPWTYRDYKRPEYHGFFDEVRGRLMEQRRRSEELANHPPESAP